MFRVVFEKQSLKDLEKLKQVHLSSKAKKLVGIIRDNPFQNPPKYEKLVGNLDGLYSRRINIQHRLVYQVYAEPTVMDGIEYEGTVKIIRMWTHYDKVERNS